MAHPRLRPRARETGVRCDAYNEAVLRNDPHVPLCFDFSLFFGWLRDIIEYVFCLIEVNLPSPYSGLILTIEKEEIAA